MRTSYWFVPSIMAAGAAVLGFGMVRVDQAVPDDWFRGAPWLYTGSAEGARTVLQTIATSMIGVAGVVFSITIVALQLASTQLGPRLLRNFMRDKGNQLTLGTFVAAFLYCVLVLRKVHGGDGDELEEFIPQLSMLVAVVLALAGLGVLIFFIHHAAASIQAPVVIASVSQDLRHAIDELYPECLGDEPAERADDGEAAARAQVPERLEADGASVTAGGGGGYVQRLDAAALMDAAGRHDLILRIEHRPGTFVQGDDVLLRAWPRSRTSQEVLDELRRSVAVGDQRSLSQDASFAMEQLVEVACRALSPGINDPFTAMQCIDRLGEALSELAGRQFPSPLRTDDAGRLRLIAQPTRFAGFLDIAFGQIRHYAGDAPEVLLRLTQALERVAFRLKREDDRAAVAAHAQAVYEQAQAAAKVGLYRTKLEDAHARVRRALAEVGRRPSP